MIRVDSALTYAVPRIRGRTRPSTIRTEPSKTLPMMLSCRQTSPSCELAVGAQAGELGAGAGAAGGAVVGLARAEHEVLAVGAGHAGRAEELDMVDLAAVRSR